MRRITLTNELVESVHDHNINYATNEIYLHGFMYDGEEEGIDYRSAAKFIKNFSMLDALHNSPIVIHLHTIGGHVKDGFAIYDIIKQSKQRVHIIGYAEVESMASVIFTAGDLRLLMPHAIVMVHNIAMTTSDNPLHGIHSYMKLVEAQQQFIITLYAEKCVEGKFFKDRGYSLSRVKSYIKRRITEKLDWHMGAEEALDLGFCDGIIGSKEYPTIESARKS